MPEPAFLVEGRMEQSIVQRLCPGKPVRLIGCNGDHVALDVIARFADAQIRLLKNSYPIVIVLDREMREESCDVIQQKLTELLNAKGHQGQFIVGVADRMTENWILASWVAICAESAVHRPYDGPSEGVDGKALIRTLLPAGESYHETTIGVDLFLRCDVQTMYRESPSFRSFLDMISIKCWWLAPVRESANS